MNIYADARRGAGNTWLVAETTLADGRHWRLIALPGGAFELQGRSPNGLRITTPFTNIADALLTMARIREEASAWLG